MAGPSTRSWVYCETRCLGRIDRSTKGLRVGECPTQARRFAAFWSMSRPKGPCLGGPALQLSSVPMRRNTTDRSRSRCALASGQARVSRWAGVAGRLYGIFPGGGSLSTGVQACAFDHPSAMLGWIQSSIPFLARQIRAEFGLQPTRALLYHAREFLFLLYSRHRIRGCADF